MLLDLDLLDCLVCCHALTNPIFQCDNGQIACSACCINLRNKCPSCTFPIGIHRCRIMERVVEAIMVPCPNAKHGCTDNFALCYCPASDCNYAALYKDLYRHYHANHRGYYETNTRTRGCTSCFEEEQGVYVTVNCVAPCAPGVSEFSYQLSYSHIGKSMSFGLDEMNRIQKVSFQIPEKDFMCVPHYFLDGRESLKMKICIRRRGEEQERKHDRGRMKSLTKLVVVFVFII
ncbi:hypothetical protein Bca52824_004031 [Brassica carinata]|uniref:RING-type E3 ubiquitin transferase n=1 Tax=Brassica carinata TaxID=52824 RepID=A0A8X7WM80_BRACI|nr:hypothetical protein Bca52824_004031 [Brassica carinata]